MRQEEKHGFSIQRKHEVEYTDFGRPQRKLAWIGKQKTGKEVRVTNSTEAGGRFEDTMI